MDTKDNKRFWRNACTCVRFATGTAVKKVVAVIHELLARYEIDPDMSVQNLFFDSQMAPPSDFDALLAYDTNDLLGPTNSVKAAIPTDPESLAMAEQDGVTCYMPEGWTRNPAVSLDNAGASANLCIGLTLARFSEKPLKEKLTKIFQEAIDYDRQSKLILEGCDVNSMPARLVAQYIFSAVGGTGAGTMYWALNDAMRACAKKDNVQVKIVTKVLCRGNLPTHDNEQADINAFLSLKYLQVADSGMYVEPATGKLLTRPCDLIFVSSNQNDHGNVTDPDRFFAHEGHADFILWHTEAGKKIRERLPDIESPEPDEYGDPRSAVTMSCATISRDSRRTIGYLSYMACAIFAEALMAGCDAGEAQKHAVNLIHLYGLIETEQDNRITSSLLKPAELAGESIIERARESLTDRAGGTRGVERMVILDDSITSIRSSDTTETYEPMMKRQAQTNRQQVEKGLDDDFRHNMHSLHGISWSMIVCSVLKAALEKSARAIMIKIEELQKILQFHEQSLAEVVEQQRDMREEGNWLKRWFDSLILLGPMVEGIETIGQGAIHFQLQTAACRIAVQDFITPLIEYIDRRWAWLSMKSQNIRQVAQICRNEAKNIAQKPTTVDTPCGIELADENYLQNYFIDYLRSQGGREKLATNILGRFLAKNQTLAALAQASIEETVDAFIDVCRQMIEPVVRSCDVIDEFQRLYPDKGKQQRIFDQLIRQSEGRLLIPGELNRPVVWLKVFSVPSVRHAEWARQMAESVDRKSGKWESAVQPDPDKMCFVQLRNNVSLAALVKRLVPEDDPEVWSKLVSRAPEPVSTLIVNPNPTLRQFRRVLAKAIVNGQLTIDENGYFSLQCPNGERLDLGRSFETVHAKLHPKWRYMVFIESSFGRNIVVAEDKIISALNRIKTQLQAGQETADARLSLIDVAAVKEAMIQAELLVPWAIRMRKASKKRHPK